MPSKSLDLPDTTGTQSCDTTEEHTKFQIELLGHSSIKQLKEFKSKIRIMLFSWH